MTGPVASMQPDLPTSAWGVGAFLLAVQDSLQARFGALAVRGELSGFSRAASGHCYFALKDAEGRAALLRCAMFRRAAMLLDFSAADGQQVEVRGRLAVYEARGELQFVVESMRRVGAGALYEEFLRKRARLEAEGWFDSARKRAIARWPATLGIVTSTGAAALRDVLATLSRRAPQVRVVIYPSPVQGAEAVPALVAALQLAAQRREAETVLLVRGGGSLEDLWCFNDERLVRAIAESPIPVICGVGHESDITLADLTADLRAATPTAAAELAAPARADALAQLHELARGLQRRMRALCEQQAQRLDTLAFRLGAPGKALALRRQVLQANGERLRLALRHGVATPRNRLEHLAMRLARSRETWLAREQRRLQTDAHRLQALNPHSVLRRGFAWVTDVDGRAVTSVAAVREGDALRTVWFDGAAQVEVRRVEGDSTNPQPPDGG
ncbi:MAG: exodeoxyribonuclease VII large subunit [Rubrivivax sp.]